MDKSVFITLEELLAWRELDISRRKNGLREMYPHRGFHGIRAITGCLCFNCANKWYLTDLERVEKHNKAIEEPLKEKFFSDWILKNGSKAGGEWNWSKQYSSIKEAQINQSLARVAILKEFTKIIQNEREQWHGLLTTLLNSKRSNDQETSFIHKLFSLLNTLLQEEADREKKLRELKPSGNQDWGLRTFVPIGQRIKKEWNGRFYMNA